MMSNRGKKMNIYYKNIMNNLLKQICLFVILCSCAFASVQLFTSPNAANGRNFERNAENLTYKVDVFMRANATDNIDLIEANVSYNNTIFYDVTISNPAAINGESGAIWETDIVDTEFDSNGNYTMVKYQKANTVGTSWALGTEDLNRDILLYTLEFKVSRNAALGGVQIPFDSRWADVQNNLGDDITGVLTNDNFSVVIDTTAPLTALLPAPGYYNADTNVAFDTDELADEATINITVIKQGEANKVYTLNRNGSVLITGNATQFVKVTVNYSAEDWAISGTNTETNKTAVYYIDRENPAIGSVLYDAGPLGIGYTARVTFNVSDASGVIAAGYPQVVFTGGAATKISGAGTGQYVFERVLTTADNNGSNFSNLTITVHDEAGNETINNITNAVQIDFGAPTFQISATPNPAAFLTTASILVTASEQLKADPIVVVSPDNYATKLSGPDVNYFYIYSYFVTGNGWTAVVPWLDSGSFGDDILPTINIIMPAIDSVDQLVDISLVFDVTDNITIDTGSIFVTINAELAVSRGLSADETSFNVVVTPLNENGYRVTVNISFPYDYEYLVTVDIAATDRNNNPVTLSYSFRTETLINAYIALSGSDLTGIGSESRPYRTVQRALDQVTANGFVHVFTGTYDQGVTINWPNKDGLTIRGADGTTSLNVVLSGGGTHRIFDLDESVSLSIRDLTIRDGFVSGNHGGAFYCTPDTAMTVNMTNIVISGNIVNGGMSGGAFYASSANIYLRDAFIIKNHAHNGGFSAYGNWDVANSIFYANSVFLNGGVALRGDWTVDNSLFQENSGPLNAAGVSYESDWVVKNSKFDRNNAYVVGVAALGHWTVNNCIFSENHSIENVGIAYDLVFDINNSTFYGNYGTDAALVYGCTVNAINTIFCKNNSNPFMNSVLSFAHCSFSTQNIGENNTFILVDDVLIGDPLFYSEASSNARFLQLAYNSPCVDAGTSNVSVTDDIRGMVRGIYDGYDIGAYEYEHIYLTAVAPDKYSTGNAATVDVTFRVRNHVEPSENINVYLAVNGVEYNIYDIIADNSSAGSTDFNLNFDIGDHYGQTVNITINITAPADQVADIFWLKTLSNALVKILSKDYAFEAPPGYNGETVTSKNMVPGSKINFTVVIFNEGEYMATDCYVKDLVPDSMHLYDLGENAPTVNGDIENVEYLGATGQAGTGSAIEYKFDLLPGGRATFNYTVTID